MANYVVRRLRYLFLIVACYQAQNLVVSKTRSGRKLYDQLPPDVIDAASKISLNSVRIFLKTDEASGRLTHHKWIWNLNNSSDEPMEYIYYVLEGDVPKRFADLNVRVIDEGRNRQKIMHLVKEKPLRKEFYVTLTHPILPQEKDRVFVIEYDWEEAERKYVYSFPARCKHYSLQLTIPRTLEIKPAVYWIDFKREVESASINPVREQTGKWVELTWHMSDVPESTNLMIKW
ncbi:MAG: hypothetical protein ACREBU_23565 [Nitrososphaera sp.]